MAIKVLDPELVSKIAAGEVIERPASVVKELVENSLDAGAGRVSVEIHNGGLTLIRVVDDGCGIPAEELETAFLSHATSKLSSLDDLETIRSLGFRGEALPSIASVSDVELLSAVAGATGRRIKIMAGSAGRAEPGAGPQGTTIAVHHLFAPTPARLKFMKSPRAEAGRIAYLMTQFALAFPEVRFTLSVDGRTTLNTGGSGRLIDAVATVYGSEVASEMLALDPPQSGAHEASYGGLAPTLTGLVSPPQLSRASRTYVSLFVNRRWVNDRTLGRAVDEAYQGLLMIGRHPIVVLHLALPPDSVDVNVHPAKREVRFRHENLVFATVSRAVKQALKDCPVPRLPMPNQPFAASPVPWQTLMPATLGGTEAAVQPRPGDWPEDWDRGQDDRGPHLRVLGQVDNSFIVAESSDGLCLVDQHAAHERILFDSLRESLAPKDIQGLLDPVNIELGPEEEEQLSEHRQALDHLGFAIETFGQRSYLVRAVPAAMAKADIAGLLREILAAGASLDGVGWQERTRASMACHGAIKAGQKLDLREAAELLGQLEMTTSPRTCPHGRPTMINLSSGELRKHFGRG
ncbi:MAG: DNA mismatch repair endonuclease MutL [Chloroflexi bacterium]|nr:DNA mismatch repair endonuclease MutL [Chloroflexota bacterium]